MNGEPSYGTIAGVEAAAVEQKRAPSLRPFFGWLLLFYSGWASLVWWGGYGPVLKEQWGIAVAMAAGSYFAGATPMGGGTVGFPVLVLLFDGPASLGRDFSFAVQSIGMVSASIFIFCRRQPLEWTLLRWALIGSLIGTPLGVLFVAPYVSGLLTKLLFAVLWASFGFLHFWKIREIAENQAVVPGARAFERQAGFAIGLVGGATVASVTGVGIDMLAYAVLVLVARADLKVAVPTSVVLMAFTSVVGLSVKAFWTGLQEGVFENWLAAAPIVALGAPVGAWVVGKIDRKPTLILVSVLCVAQLIWTVWKEWAQLGPVRLLGIVVALIVFNAMFVLFYKVGKRMAGE